MNELIHWLSFDPSSPLTFTRAAFWVFFAAVLLGFGMLERRQAMRNAYLFLASLLFYWKTSGWFVLILLFSTGADWAIGHRIHAAIGAKRKLWLALSITVNLLLLFYFKYAYFFVDSFNAVFGSAFHPGNHFGIWANAALGTTFRVDRILLPVGISFYTFQTMSYAIDLYRKEVQPVRSILDFGFYVSFFPQLVAGPIVRAKEFIPQLYKPYSLTRAGFGMALFWILNGLLKKVWLADYLALNLVDRVFAAPGSYTGAENLFALYGYSLQVYADFSGYTDMAIGIALLLGFTLPQNFNSPYKARNVGEFWKRWHISLSSWLKDYLYIPMGGNRGGSLFTLISASFFMGFFFLMTRSWGVVLVTAGIFLMGWALALRLNVFRSWVTTNVNMLMTMLLGGLWHGASWNFVLWGGLNGLGLVVYKLWRKISPWESKTRWWMHVVGVAITFNFISFTRIWFRTGSKTTWESLGDSHNLIAEWFTANDMLIQLGSMWSSPWGEVIRGYRMVLGVMAAGFLIHFIPESVKVRYRRAFAEAPIAVQLTGTLLAVIVAWQALSAGLQPFIYFQF